MRSFDLLRTGLALIALVTACTTTTAAADTEADTGEQELDALTQRVATLEQRIRTLDARRGDRWLTEARAAEIRALVTDVLADADTRAAMLSRHLTSGHDGSFFIATADGSFRLNIKGQIQFRFDYSHQNNGPVDNDRWGFENSRTRIGFGGHIIDPSWTFMIWGGPTGSFDFLLLDAWLEKQFDNGLSIRVGQFKLPLSKEWMVFETRQQFVERSIIDARYAQVYAKGVVVRHEADVVRTHLAVSDGLRTLNTRWGIGPNAFRPRLPFQMSNEFALTARIEWKLAGTWSQYGDFTSFRGEDPMYVFGGAVHYQVGEYGTGDDEIELLQWTVDGSLKFGGANVFAAVIGTNVDDQTAVRSEIAFLVQGGVFVADDWEIIARYGWGDNDGAGLFEDRVSVLTVGLNHFVTGHMLKWTSDVGYAFLPIDPSWSAEPRGYRTDSPGEDGQIVLRTQVQLLF